jgi:hypothetical protein
LREEEHGLEIDVHHRIPVLFRELQRFAAPDDSGVVHENVEVACPTHHVLHDGGQARGRTEIRIDRQKLSSGRLHRSSRLGGSGTSHGRDVCARLSQRHRDRLSEPGVRTGHDGG